MLAALGLGGVGVGVLLLWSAVANLSPVDVVRSVFDPKVARGQLDPTPSTAAANGARHALAQAFPTTQGVAGLAEPLASRVAALLDQSGGKVWIVSGRRSRAEQIELRRQHCGPTEYDIYRKPSSQCSPPTARPGSSRHESGEAVDLGGDLSLAAQLGRALGLHTNVPGEPWHFEVLR